VEIDDFRARGKKIVDRERKRRKSGKNREGGIPDAQLAERGQEMGHKRSNTVIKEENVVRDPEFKSMTLRKKRETICERSKRSVKRAMARRWKGRARKTGSDQKQKMVEGTGKRSGVADVGRNNPSRMQKRTH